MRQPTGTSRATNRRRGIHPSERLCAPDIERNFLRKVARVRHRRHHPVLFAEATRGRHDQVDSQQDHRRRYELALLQRAQTRAEGLSMRAALALTLAALAIVTLASLALVPARDA